MAQRLSGVSAAISKRIIFVSLRVLRFSDRKHAEFETCYWESETWGEEIAAEDSPPFSGFFHSIVSLKPSWKECIGMDRWIDGVFGSKAIFWVWLSEMRWWAYRDPPPMLSSINVWDMAVNRPLRHLVRNIILASRKWYMEQWHACKDAKY